MAVTINYEQIRITELDSYLFGQGTHYEIYNKMGAHIAKKDGKPGVYFAVWAPAAKDVYVIGEFNDWKPMAMYEERFQMVEYMSYL